MPQVKVALSTLLRGKTKCRDGDLREAGYAI
jgi:hypothetical protein